MQNQLKIKQFFFSKLSRLFFPSRNPIVTVDPAQLGTPIEPMPLEQLPRDALDYRQFLLHWLSRTPEEPEEPLIP